MSERDTQRAILDLLAAERVLAFRMNTGAMAGSHKGKKWFVRFGEKGMADVLAFAREKVPFTSKCAMFVIRPLWIEVKDAKGKQSDDQIAFQKRVEAEGHSYLLARDSEDVKSKLAELRAEGE